MAAVTAASTRNCGPVGQYRLVRVTITAASDTDTYTHGGGRIAEVLSVQTNGNPTTQASAGIGWTRSGSVITLYPGEDALGVIIFLLLAS